MERGKAKSRGSVGRTTEQVQAKDDWGLDWDCGHGDRNRGSVLTRFGYH
jgi:hypothetical protein